MPGIIDLHTHSSVSDGTLTPAQLVDEAIGLGLHALAITDHDTTAGWDEARIQATGSGLTIVPGMELSTRHGYRSVHLLAYLIDPEDEALVAETERIREGRFTRAEDMVRLLGRDFDLDWDDVTRVAGTGATIGRPHIADALVARGHAPDRTTAFREILHPSRGYYVPHYAPDPLTAIALVRGAGGVPVLAHPGTRGIENVIPEEYLAQLVNAGLFGLEIDHPENGEAAKVRLRALAEKFGLRVTGSSDYHGTGKVNRLGECSTHANVLDAIYAEGTGTGPFLP